MVRAGRTVLSAGVVLLVAAVALEALGAKTPFAFSVISEFFDGRPTPAIVIFFERLPSSCALLFASVAVAWLVAAALAALATFWKNRVTGASAGALSIALRSLPFFVIVPFAAMFAFVRWQSPPPVAALCTLAVVQIAPAFDALCDLWTSGGFAFWPSLRRLFAVFAHRLPEIIGVLILVELFFAQPGLGRTYWNLAQQNEWPAAVAIVAFCALAVLVVRFVADV